MLKSIFLFAIFSTISSQIIAQEFPELDKSPHDISIYKTNDRTFKVIYGRPQKAGRTVFGKLVPFGKVWRTGANESTEIKFYQDVKINETVIKAGSYSLFSIPDKDKWTIIINSELDQWGAYSYKREKDVLRAEARISKTKNTIEAFSITFTDAPNGVYMYLAWDDTMAQLPIEFLPITQN